ncbi:hypothetical protein M0813_18982 [Anaeramoeba flamelloides]|uniref:Uncharacterized protein n=1 Tax=Anaeramoeba flamelloides TaxID=1746091 RepID=A0ABQ8YSH8_9EUKA|nr:hypothetical protein M0813_18982 [Anaeramoeba flamelloides]
MSNSINFKENYTTSLFLKRRKTAYQPRRLTPKKNSGWNRRNSIHSPAMRRPTKSTTTNHNKTPKNCQGRRTTKTYHRTPKSTTTNYQKTPIRQQKKQTKRSSIKRTQKKSYEKRKIPTIKQKTPFKKTNSKKKPKQQRYEQQNEQKSTSSYFLPLQSRSKKEITSTPRILCDQNKRQAILKNSVKYILTPGKLKTRNTPFKTPSSRRKKTCIQQIGQMYREITTPKTSIQNDYSNEFSEPDLMSFTPIKTTKSKTFTKTNVSKPLFFGDNQNSLI